MGQAYGFFEIPSVTAAVVAIDIMCKTAEVELVTWEKKLGGRLVTVIIRGDVSSVIPSPHEEILKLIENSANRVC